MQLNSTPWRTHCRKLAAAQAADEARRVWQLSAEATPPFNHRWEHVQEVVRLALLLADATGSDREITEAAAWLHDVCKGEPKHAALGADAALRSLPQTDFPPAKMEAVAQAIRQHEGMTRPKNAPPLQPLEAAILWDADKLTKLGVQALAFMLSAHYLAGLSLAERRRNCLEFVDGPLIRTVTSMNTAPARALAEERHRHMVTLLAMWAQEEDRSLFTIKESL